MAQKIRLSGIAMMMLLILGLAACGNSDNDEASAETTNDNENTNEESVELGDKDITIPFVPWADYEARLTVLAQVMDDVGYNVDLTEVEAGPMFTSVADESSDFTAMWLPDTHKEYMDEYEDDIEKVNKVQDQAPLSLAVPEYMADDVESIEDLKDNDELGESVDWTITGIDPGAGIMSMTEDAMDEYELDNWELQESSEAAMLSEVDDAIDNEDPILFTGWEPHWMFGAFDLELLDDPEEVYGGDGDQIYLVARNDFEDDSPAAYKILEQYTEDPDQFDDLMGDIHEADDPEEVAKDFVEDNQDLVDEWTDGVESE